MAKKKDVLEKLEALPVSTPEVKLDFKITKDDIIQAIIDEQVVNNQAETKQLNDQVYAFGITLRPLLDQLHADVKKLMSDKVNSFVDRTKLLMPEIQDKLTVHSNPAGELVHVGGDGDTYHQLTSIAQSKRASKKKECLMVNQNFFDVEDHAAYGTFGHTSNGTIINNGSLVHNGLKVPGNVSVSLSTPQKKSTVTFSLQTTLSIEEEVKALDSFKTLKSKMEELEKMIDTVRDNVNKGFELQRIGHHAKHQLVRQLLGNTPEGKAMLDKLQLATNKKLTTTNKE